MKRAVVTPIGPYLPLLPSALLGYATAALLEHGEVDVYDLCMRVHAAHRPVVGMALHQLEQTGEQAAVMLLWGMLAAQARAEYTKVRWTDYEQVFVTQPGWTPTLPAGLVVELADVIATLSPATQVRYFGTSLGTWTDVEALGAARVRPAHLNSLLTESCGLTPIDYDRLRTPAFRELDGYVFPLLPFRLRHGCCWAQCRFCSISRGAGAGYLERSIERVAEELAELVDTYNPEGLVCHDNAVNSPNLPAFCAAIGAVGRPWLCAARSDLPLEHIRALAASGCKGVYLGIESGSDSVLRAMNKGTLLADNDRVLTMLAGEGIEPVPSVFVGSPWESEADFADTCRLLRRHRGRVHTVNVYKFRWSPGADAAEAGQQPPAAIAHRYDALVEVCRENDMLPVAGITTLEYLFCKVLCPRTQGYGS